MENDFDIDSSVLLAVGLRMLDCKLITQALRPTTRLAGYIPGGTKSKYVLCLGCGNCKEQNSYFPFDSCCPEYNSSIHHSLQKLNVYASNQESDSPIFSLLKAYHNAKTILNIY